jgi:stage III sporulation protein AB
MLNDSNWNDALEKCKNKFDFNDSVYETLYNFGSELGISLKEEQINNCEYTLSQLQNYKKQVQDELPKKVKLIKSLSILAGISVVIILI